MLVMTCAQAMNFTGMKSRSEVDIISRKIN
jgi:hypothetical protein